MQASEIRRTRTAPEVVPEPMIIQEAADILGYGAARKIVRAEKLSELAAKLAEIEIDTLNQQDVVRYQCEMAAEKFLDSDFHREIAESGVYYRWHLTIWERTEISQYSEPIPEFVLNKAIQIKKAISGVVLYVEHLEMRSDPFLMAKLGKDEWSSNWEYIEVWAEPKFEGRGR